MRIGFGIAKASLDPRSVESSRSQNTAHLVPACLHLSLSVVRHVSNCTALSLLSQPGDTVQFSVSSLSVYASSALAVRATSLNVPACYLSTGSRPSGKFRPPVFCPSVVLLCPCRMCSWTILSVQTLVLHQCSRSFASNFAPQSSVRKHQGFHAPMQTRMLRLFCDVPECLAHLFQSTVHCASA